MKIYLSHDLGEATRQGAETLLERVRSAGIEIETAASPSGLPAGSDWRQALEQEINDSDALVFVVDKESERSRWLQREWSVAAEQSWSQPAKPMIPVVVGQVDVPPFLRERQAIRVAPDGNWDEVAQSLVSAIEHRSDPDSAQQPRGEEARAEQRQRLSQIAEEAAKLEPSAVDRETQLKLIEEQLAKARDRDPRSYGTAELEIKLADALKALQRNEEAVTHLRTALDVLKDLRATKGSEVDRQLARIHANLGRTLDMMGKPEEARDQWRSALEFYQRVEGANSLMVALSHSALADLSKRLGDRKAEDEHWKAALSSMGSALKNQLVKLPILGKLFDK